MKFYSKDHDQKLKSKSAVKNQTLLLSSQDLIELNLTNCSSLSARSLKTLTCFRDTLVSLSLFGCTQIFFRKGGAPLACGEDVGEGVGVLDIRDMKGPAMGRPHLL